MDQQPYFTYSRKQSLKSAADSWVNAQGIQWDIAACWHLPVCDIGSDIDDVEIRVGKKLRRYFNTLDRHIFKAKHKRGFRVRRFITLEHAAGVGWHVHGVLETPQHVEQATLIDQVRQT
ncbi:hypothetical protein WDZ92_51775, partial [Nostoc sp. NIES-2111]